jgi:hypothetical protein
MNALFWENSVSWPLGYPQSFSDKSMEKLTEANSGRDVILGTGVANGNDSIRGFIIFAAFVSDVVQFGQPGELGLSRCLIL